MPSFSIIVIIFVSTSKPASGFETSFATTMSRFFPFNLEIALLIISLVSAAKPTTTLVPLFLPISDSMSVTSVSAMLISLPLFLIFS